MKTNKEILLENLQYVNIEDNVVAAFDVYLNNVIRMKKITGSDGNEYRYFKLGDIDRYSERFMAEFKLHKERNLISNSDRAAVIAQSMCYANDLYCGNKPVYVKSCIPQYSAGISERYGFIYNVSDFCEFYRLPATVIDWSCPPSNPDKKLVEMIKNTEVCKNMVVYDFSDDKELREFLNLVENAFSNKSISKLKKTINSLENCQYLYNKKAYGWSSLIGSIIANQYKNEFENESELNKFVRSCFYADITHEKSFYDSRTSELTLIVGDKNVTIEIGEKKYKTLWENYDKIGYMESRIIKMQGDRFLDMSHRKVHGDYYTPPLFVQHGMRYITDAMQLKNIDWKSGRYRFADFSGGTGNLEAYLPTEALPYVYLSSLESPDIVTCKELYPTAKTWQYDYLNDDVTKDGIDYSITNKVPKEFLADLANEDIIWIVYMNPPYGNSSEKYKVAANSGSNVDDKSTITNTNIKEQMVNKGIAAASTTQLYVQFLYRLKEEFKGRKVYLGLFSPTGYLTGEKFIDFRKRVFNAKFLNGFTFSSKCFHGVSQTGWTVLFSVWDLNVNVSLYDQVIEVDSLNKFCKKTLDEKKRIVCLEDTNNLLDSIVIRPENKSGRYLPTMKSAYNQAFDAKTKAKQVAKNYLAWARVEKLYSDTDKNFILSCPCSANAGYSITEENFIETIINVGVKRGLIIKTPYNTGNQTYKPNRELSDDFVTDMVVYTMFDSDMNGTIPYKNMEVDGESYGDVKNQFYPFSLNFVRNVKCSSRAIIATMEQEESERFLYTWLSTRYMSKEATMLYDIVETMYTLFYNYVVEFDKNEFRLCSWDVGFKQVIDCLRTIKNDEEDVAEILEQYESARKEIRTKLRIEAIDYGMIRE